MNFYGKHGIKHSIIFYNCNFWFFLISPSDTKENYHPNGCLTSNFGLCFQVISCNMPHFLHLIFANCWNKLTKTLYTERLCRFVSTCNTFQMEFQNIFRAVLQSCSLWPLPCMLFSCPTHPNQMSLSGFSRACWRAYHLHHLRTRTEEH